MVPESLKFPFDIVWFLAPGRPVKRRLNGIKTFSNYNGRMCITPLLTNVTSDSVHDLVDLAPFTKSSFNNYVDIGRLLGESSRLFT